MSAPDGPIEPPSVEEAGESSGNVIEFRPRGRRVDPDNAPGFRAAASARLYSLCHTIADHEDWKGVLAFDDYRNQIVKRKPTPWNKDEKSGEPWTAHDYSQTRLWLSDKYSMTATREVLHDAIDIVANRTHYHSLLEELRSVTWDETKRIDTWLEVYAGAQASELTRAMARKFLLSAVARAIEPGCTVQHVLVLEGATGLGKTRLLRALAGREHFSDSPIDMSSIMNAPIMLDGVWFFSFDELAMLKNATPEQVNQFVTLDRDDYVVKHTNAKKRQPRTCVFTATTSKHEWLLSKDGARRWWPIAVGPVCNGKLDVDGIERDRGQLFAEALLAHDARERWYLEGELEALASVEQGARAEIDEWEPLLSRYIDQNAWRFMMPGAFVTVNELLQKAVKITDPKSWGPKERARISRIMIERFEWTRGKQCRAPDGQGRVYPLFPPTHTSR